VEAFSFGIHNYVDDILVVVVYTETHRLLQGVLRPCSSCCWNSMPLLHYEYIPFETIADLVVVLEDERVVLRLEIFHNNVNITPTLASARSKRWMSHDGLVDPEAFDHALVVAWKEDFIGNSNYVQASQAAGEEEVGKESILVYSSSSVNTFRNGHKIKVCLPSKNEIHIIITIKSRFQKFLPGTTRCCQQYPSSFFSPATY
jgi:hypothetical protein